MTLEDAVTAARVELGDRVKPYGWTDEAGVFILHAVYGDERDQMLGASTLARVSGDDGVSAVPFVVVMDEIDRMARVGVWPAEYLAE